MLHEKIKAELRKQGLPESLAKFVNVQNETEIEAAVAELKSFAKPATLEDILKDEALKGQYQSALQKEADRRVTEAIKTHETKLKEKYDFKEKSQGGNDPQPPTGFEKQFEQLTALISKQNETINQLVTEKQISERKTQISSKLKDKGVKGDYANLLVHLKDEELDSQIETLKNQEAKLEQDKTDEWIANGGRPPVSKGSGDNLSSLKEAAKKVITEIDPATSATPVHKF